MIRVSYNIQTVFAQFIYSPIDEIGLRRFWLLLINLIIWNQ